MKDEENDIRGGTLPFSMQRAETRMSGINGEFQHMKLKPNDQLRNPGSNRNPKPLDTISFLCKCN